MDYFNNVLTIFLGLEHGSYVAVYEGSQLLDFIKNILICVPKMNEGLTDDKLLMTEFSCLGELSL